jgi:hypothetical protein
MAKIPIEFPSVIDGVEIIDCEGAIGYAVERMGKDRFLAAHNSLAWLLERDGYLREWQEIQNIATGIIDRTEFLKSCGIASDVAVDIASNGMFTKRNKKTK